jgi:hypothetical protein
MGGDTPNPTETLNPIAGEFEGGNLGLAWCTDTNPNNLAAAIEVGTNGLVNFRADGR